MDIKKASPAELGDAGSSKHYSNQARSKKILLSVLAKSPVTKESLKTPVSAFKVGDVLAVFETDQSRARTYGYGYYSPKAPEEGTTLGALLADRNFSGWTLYVVRKATGKTIFADAILTRGSRGPLDDSMPEFPFSVADYGYPTRMAESKYRYTVPTGMSLDEFVAAVNADPKTATWTRIAQEVEDIYSELQARTEAAQEKANVLIAPLKEVEQTVNTALGYDLLDVWNDTVYPGNVQRGDEREPYLRFGWCREAEVHRVEHHIEVLYGRAAMGKITETQRDEAVKALREAKITE